MKIKIIVASWCVQMLLGYYFSGCGEFFPDNPGGGSGQTGFVYTLNQNAGSVSTISGFGANANSGVLTGLTGTTPAFPVAVGVSNALPNSMVGDPSGKFLFVSNPSAPSASPPIAGAVNGFTINSTTGALTAASGGSISTGTGGALTGSPIAIAIRPSGNALYVAEAAQIEGFSISSTGSLTALPHNPYALPGTAAAPTTVVATNTFLFIGTANGAILSAPINQTDLSLPSTSSGFMSASPQSPATRVDGLSTDSGGTVLYAVDSTKSKVSAYTINASTGALANVMGSPYNTGTGPLSVAVNSKFNLVFTANQAASNISSFLIGTGGALTEATTAGSPFAAGGSGPVWVANDPSGNFLYVANKGSTAVSSFVVLSTGGLTAASTPSASTAAPPVVVVAVP